MANKKKYDFIVLGGGSAGYAAARTAREHSDSVAIVDGAQELGGLCILKGCMPSKTLIYSTEILHLAQKAELFGLQIANAKIDMAALHARKKRIITEFSEYRQEQLESDRFELYRSQAQFTGPNSIQLEDGTELEGKKILIATGSSVNTPSIPGLADVPALSSDDILELNYLPESVIVLGGGVIACELAQFLSRAGSKVIQIQRNEHLLKEGSTESSTVIEQAFRDEGITLYTDTSIEQISEKDKRLSVTFKSKGKTITETATHLFNALGRKPNTEKLQLDKAGVETLASGHIATLTHQQSSNPNIYAAGDCAGPHEIVHIAIMQGECAANHAFNKKSEPVDYRALNKIIFTDPQIAHIGPSEEELNNAGIDFISASYPFDDHGKSILMEAKYGYVKIYAEKSSGITIAAECVGKDASELIHSMAVAISLRATVYDLVKTHWYHPTLSEIWSYPIEDLIEELEAED